ncbi:hypothetical protein AQ490_09395 [Wenjunlia vitaminophila]|uniref:DUF397 domain-containing protein n=1 Tax=Wenjunlia vitaminophila TaxID=76728 RepID=A0A0T6LME9_WENVI|nr:DUF397 domain-containing protein [Wenjunlia vitaminophila]KRV47192.1 hypothetical protein AQ490_09395 [Wenjunlia vitaminophila]
MRNAENSGAIWRKSSHSSGNGQCVEIAFLDEAVTTRDSKDPQGPVLVFSVGGWASFVSAVKRGEFLPG